MGDVLEISIGDCHPNIRFDLFVKQYLFALMDDNHINIVGHRKITLNAHYEGFLTKKGRILSLEIHIISKGC
jgi:hypothetical protein